MSVQTQQTETEKQSLSDELFRLKEYSVGEDTVQAEITGVERGKDAIIVEFERLTTGETGKELMDIPEPWTEEFKFVRLLHHCGYNSASPEMLVGDTVPVQKPKKRGQWRIAIDVGGRFYEESPEFYSGVARGAVLVLTAGLGVAALNFMLTAPLEDVLFTIPMAPLFLIFGGLLAGWLFKNPYKEGSEKK